MCLHITQKMYGYPFTLESGGSRSTISVTGLRKRVKPPGLMTLTSTWRTFPSWLGKVCVTSPRGHSFRGTWLFLRRTTLPGLTFGWTDCHFFALPVGLVGIASAICPRMCWKVLNLPPLAFVQVCNSKLACRCSNRVHLLCEKNRRGEYERLIRVRCHGNKGPGIDNGCYFCHEGHQHLVGKFVFQLEEHWIKNSSCKPNHSFPCSTAMGSMRRIKNPSAALVWQIRLHSFAVNVWRYL